MTAAPDVSVIMANYNGARYLRAALQSLMRQTLKSWELILVDDASSDESVAVAEQTANGDSRVHIIRQTANGGPAAARNRALDAVSGKWIAVFDSDDLMVPQRLELLLERARADDATIVADNLMLFSDSHSRPRRYLRNRLGRSPHWIGLAEFIDSTWIYSRTPDLGYLKPMIRADVVRRLGARYDERLRIGEDYNFLVRIMAQGHQLRLDPSAMYLYQKHATSTSHRFSAADIRAILDADERFLRQAGLTFEESASLKRRIRSLESQLIYDGVIAAIKGGDPGRGATIALSQPRIWLLLTRPVTARLIRLSRKLRPDATAPARCSNA